MHGQDSGGTAESAGRAMAPAGGLLAWGWRLGLSALALLLLAVLPFLLGLESGVALLLWWLAWRGGFCATWPRKLVALLTFPFLAVWLLAMGIGVTDAVHEYQQGTARVTIRHHLHGPGRRLQLHPTLRVPDETPRWRCGTGVPMLALWLQGRPGYESTLGLLVRRLGPMEGSYLGRLPSVDEAMVEVEEEGVPLPLEQAAGILGPLVLGPGRDPHRRLARELEGIMRPEEWGALRPVLDGSAAATGRERDPGLDFRRTPARDGAWLLSVEPLRPLPPEPGRHPALILLVRADRPELLASYRPERPMPARRSSNREVPE